MINWGKKSNAGALQYVLVIATVIVIILLAFIQLVYLQEKLAIKRSQFKEAIYNVNNGFAYTAGQEIPYDVIVTKTLSENEKEETEFLKKSWGVFDLVTITSTVNKETFKKVGLLGNTIQKEIAIYLVDNNTPLIVVGNTRVKGDVSLPKQGVKRGNIAGNSFYGNVLINGNIRLSSNSLPKLAQETSIKNIYNKRYLNDSIKSIELEYDTELIQSFQKSTQYYGVDETIKLEGVNLKGNFIIESTRKITVTRSCTLEDVILIAPTIEIQSNVVGNFQAFATKKIEVKNNCKLKYPSALVVYNKGKKVDEEEGIFIGKGTTVKGAIVFKQKEQEGFNYNPQIKLDQSATVVGQVFCEGNTEISGEVIGGVYTKNFITKQYGSTYINHLYDAKINSEKLPLQFAGLGLDAKHKGVAKWLY
ncbi:hypothetical protein [Tenacibaculum amylolyticum]|uniref:hypothetical protein n=1 Tax=Tenacibaculum amylolyticum TaxID=104269 RepID=UPI00389496DC